MTTLAEAWAATAGKGSISERIYLVRAMTKPDDTGRRVPIQAQAIKKLWSRWMVLAQCEIFVSDKSPGVLGAAYTPEIHMARVVCQATLRNLQGDVFSDLDPSDPEAAGDIDNYLTALMGAGVLTQEQKDATLALAIPQVPAFDPSDVDIEPLLKAGLITEADIQKAEP